MHEVHREIENNRLYLRFLWIAWFVGSACMLIVQTYLPDAYPTPRSAILSFLFGVAFFLGIATLAHLRSPAHPATKYLISLAAVESAALLLWSNRDPLDCLAFFMAIVFSVRHLDRRLVLFTALLSLLNLPLLFLLDPNLTFHLSFPASVLEVALFFFLYLMSSLALCEYADQLVVARTEKEVAEASSRSKSRFVATVSHELRTPMHGILGATELLLLDATPKQRELLESVQTSARGLLFVINDILDFSKIEKGKLVLAEEPFELRSLTQRVTTLLAVLAREKGLELRSEIAPDVPDHLRGDAIRLQQVLLNLLGNALKFTQKGSVCLKVQTEGKNLRFIVEDTGVGIPPEKQAHIFEPFAQADESASRAHEGTGLGLAITREIVHLMRGTIDVESNPEVGSRFSFTLPLHEAPPPEKHATGKLPPLPPLRILVAEDNPINQQLILRMLQGHEIAIAHNGEEAVARWQEKKFDLVLMDLRMPRLDGLQASQRIRAAGGKTPIIALTASALKEDQAECEKAGMDGFLSKPVSQASLLGEIRRVLGGALSEGIES